MCISQMFSSKGKEKKVRKVRQKKKEVLESSAGVRKLLTFWRRKSKDDVSPDDTTVPRHSETVEKVSTGPSKSVHKQPGTSALVDSRAVLVPNSLSQSIDQPASVSYERHRESTGSGKLPVKRASRRDHSELGAAVKRVKQTENVQTSELLPKESRGELIPEDSRDGRHQQELAQLKAKDGRQQQDIAQLKAKLKSQEDAHAQERAKLGYYSKLENEIEELRRHLEELSQSKDAAETENQMAWEAIQKLETEVRELHDEKSQLLSKLKLNEQILAECRTDIVRLSNERPDSKHDDHYLEQSLSRVFQSIQGWVLQHYLSVNFQSEDGMIIHPLLQKFLTAAVGEHGVSVLESEPLFTIQAYIAFSISSQVFEPALLGLFHDTYGKVQEAIAPCAESEELIKWRISTIKMIIRRDDFWTTIASKVEEIANEIVASLAPLVSDPNGSSKLMRRTKKLKAIVDQAAKLAIELEQEPSTLSYTYFRTGTPCGSLPVSDAHGLRHDDELQMGDTSVRLTVYPAVLRKGHEDDEIVIVKAKILASET